MIQIAKNPETIARVLGAILLSKEVVSELGESVVFDEGDRFFFEMHGKYCIGFACLSEKGKLKYMYVLKSERGKGIFTKLLKSVEEMALSLQLLKIKATSTALALPMYQKKGYKVTKSFTNFYNIEKVLNQLELFK
jgi:GNAT superfamily N-acetyltransferase